MSFIPRIFINEELFPEKEIKLTDKTFHYIINVMRSKIGDNIILINGKDGEFISNLTSSNNKYALIKITTKTKEYHQPQFFGLIFAPIKNIDIVLKSSTELGVTDFLPIITEYTNKNIRLNKIEGNIIEAVEQSERLDLPKINKIETLKTVLNKLNDNNSIIFFCEERSGKNSPVEIYNNIKITGKKIYALIGPEGGFSETEKELIKSYKNVVSINLGETILRTETATIAVLSILKNFFNALKIKI